MNFSEWLQFKETLALKGDYKGGIFQRLVAAFYQLAPHTEPEALEAFRDLAKKIKRQYEFLSSKYRMKPTTDDPYPSMKSMSQDIDMQKQQGFKRPNVLTYAVPPQQGEEDTGHPALSDEENTEQRFVHDVIAHYFGQHPFSARGEYASYNRHLKTLCNIQQVKNEECLAAKALFTEIVGQTSYYYIYGTYVSQKAVILDHFDHYHVGQLHPSSPLNNFFEVVGKQLKLRDDFNWKEFRNSVPKLAQELKKQSKGEPLVPLQPITPEEFEEKNDYF